MLRPDAIEQRLYISWRLVGSKMAKRASSTIPILLVGLFIWHAWEWAVGAALLGALLFAAMAKKEIIVDASGFRLVPLLPLLHRKRVRWDDIAELASATRDGDECVLYWLEKPKRRRVRRSKRGDGWLSSTFAPERGAPALAAQDLAELMNAWRPGRSA